MTTRYLTPKQVHQMIGRAVSTLAKDRSNKRGLPYYRLGMRQIRYKEEDVVKFMEEDCIKVVHLDGL